MTHDFDSLPTLMNQAVSGRYWITTATGSEYVLDLDWGLVIRSRPDDTGELPGDDNFVLLYEVREATVGQPMVLVIGLDLQTGAVTTRTTSEVMSIARVKASSRWTEPR